MTSPTHYEVLGVARSATVEEIRAAYRAAARRAHPDSGGDLDRMQRLNAAWHVLGDPGRRAAYDRSLPGVDPRRTAATGPAGDVGDPGGDSEDAGGDAVEVVPPDMPRVEGWWALLPPATLVLAVAMGIGAFVFDSPALLVFAGGTLFLAVGLFVLVPLRAMLPPVEPRDET